MKKIVVAVRLILMLLIVAGFVAAMMMRGNALLFFLQDFSVLQQMKAALPSFFFYLGLGGWFITLERSWARNAWPKQIGLSIYVLLVLLFDMFSSFALKWEASGMNLFAFYYWLTQFGVLNSGYYVFKLGFYALFAGVFITFTALGIVYAVKRRAIFLLCCLGLSLLLLAASFIVYGSMLRKDISLHGLSYTLSSTDKTPTREDFIGLASPEPQQTFTVDLQDAKRKNVVVIVLESTRKDALNFYNPGLNIDTPFWNELAKQSHVFTNMYATIPSTIKALTSINCAVVPYLNFPILESIYGLPNACLAEFLKAYGYQSAFIQSATKDYGNIRALVKQWGFDTFISAEDLEGEGFKSNPFGYEDSILLASNQQWLAARDKPFFALYLTTGPHWPYNLYDTAAAQYVDKQLGQSYTAIDEKYPLDGAASLRPNYLKTIVHQDAFLRALIAQFKAAGLYENSLFVFVADHGVVLGDRKQYLRANSLFQEVVNVPFMVHIAGQAGEASVNPVLLSQTDIPHIITNILLGKATLAGIANEQVFSSCWFWQWCIARVDHQYKYIHNFDSVKDELYDLQQDPKEQNNIIDQHAELALQFKRQTLAWYRQQLSVYRQLYEQHDKQFYLRGHPLIEHPQQ